VERLRDAGIHVVTTLDVSQVESLADVVEQITGRTAGGLVPDAVVGSAEQIQLVDQTPEALRRRLAHGNIFPSEQVDAAVDASFRPDALSELRELTMRWLADRVHQQHSPDLGRPSEASEGILVALSGAPTSPAVLRRAARIADRQGAPLVGVHVRAPGDPAEPPSTLVEQRQLLEALGGRYLEVAADDVATALAQVARTERLTQLVVGASGRSRWQQLRNGSMVDDVIRYSPVDVHVVGTSARRSEPDAPPARRSGGRQTAQPRAITGWLMALALPVVTAAALVAVDRHLDLPAQLLIMLLAVTAVSAVGGAGAGAFAAVSAFLLANWCFIPPVHQLSISNTEDALSLTAFLVVAVVIGSYVSVSARRSAEAARARADASALASLAGTAATLDNPLPALVDRLRVAYGGNGATLFTQVGDASLVLASAGLEAPSEPSGAQLLLPVGADARLAVAGSDLRGVDPEVTSAFLDQLAVAVDRQRLRAAEEEARTVAAANELRTALLAAVSHDLRTPLATVKAASSTLAELDGALDPDVRQELLSTIDEGTDRLTALVVNLLGMSRIQAGAVDLALGPVLVDEVVHRALLTNGRAGAGVSVDLSDDLPPAIADRALLEQVVGNLTDNAVKWSPGGQTVRVDGTVAGDRLRLRVVDHGPGIPAAERDRVLQPFQRIHDHAGRDQVAGTGLGLAVASGFCRLMDVELLLEDTPGGGTTATLVLPIAPHEVGTRASH